MNLLDRAVIFAAGAHSGAFRKGTDIPYIVHPLEAAAIAAAFTSDKEIIAAAVLHDTIEDTFATPEIIEKEFGKRVLALVMSDSEDKMEDRPESETWRARKEATLEALKKSSMEEQIICIADKLSNLRAIYRDYRKLGEKLWERFNQKDKNEQGWYYCGIAKCLDKISDSAEYEEYCGLLIKVFGNR